jgi:DNA polymerase III subunit alpha
LPPDINESDDGFTPSENAVRFGLNAIKGIGTNSVRAIMEARKKGAFTSIYDFSSRIDQGMINRRGLESLITAGAFDSLKSSDISVNCWRARLFAAVDGALSHGQRIWSDKLKGQNALFSTQDSSNGDFEHILPEAAEWSQAELCSQEKSAIGFYLSNHPLDNFQNILTDLKIKNIADFEEIRPGDKISLAGIVSACQVRHSKKGNRFCIFKLEDQSSHVKCLAWADIYAKFSDCLRDDEILIIDGKVESNDGPEITLILEEAKKLSDAVPLKARKVSIEVSEESLTDSELDNLVGLIGGQRGECEVEICFKLNQKVSVRINSQPLRILGTSRLEMDLKRKGCQIEWVL